MSPSHNFLSGFCLISPGAGEEILWPRPGAGPWCTKGTPSSGICLQHTHSLLFSPLSGTILLGRVRLQVVTCHRGRSQGGDTGCQRAFHGPRNTAGGHPPAPRWRLGGVSRVCPMSQRVGTLRGLWLLSPWCERCCFSNLLELRSQRLEMCVCFCPRLK